jgi:hypothetical protein
VSEHSSLVGVLLNAPRRSVFAAISPWLVFEHPWIDVRHPLHLVLSLGAHAAREGSAVVPVPGESPALATLVRTKLVRRFTNGQLEVRGTPPAARILKRRALARRRQRKHRGLTGDGTVRRTRRVHRPWETRQLPPTTIAGVRWSVDLFRRCWRAGFVALYRPFDLWLVSWLYCYVAHTDGLVPHGALEAYTSCGVEAAIRALVAIGAWIPVEGGYQVWGFSRFNWSTAKIARRRADPVFQAICTRRAAAYRRTCHASTKVQYWDQSTVCSNPIIRAEIDHCAHRAFDRPHGYVPVGRLRRGHAHTPETPNTKTTRKTAAINPITLAPYTREDRAFLLKRQRAIASQQRQYPLPTRAKLPCVTQAALFGRETFTKLFWRLRMAFKATLPPDCTDAEDTARWETYLQTSADPDVLAFNQLPAPW